jgi:hypothetical protein
MIPIIEESSRIPKKTIKNIKKGTALSTGVVKDIISAMQMRAI